MSILSPAEHAEVTRFGVHDEDILNDLEERWDDTPACDVRHGGKCQHAATHTVTCRYCGDLLGLCCTPHTAWFAGSTQRVWHEACGAIDLRRNLTAVRPL